MLMRIYSSNTTFLAALAIVMALTFSSCKKSKTYSSSNKGKTGKVEANTSAARVISTARSYTGTKYKYGGTTRKGMDCSGLICTSFRAVNVNLPRTSRDQSKAGREIKIKDIQPGDLVFFAAKKGSRKITHVGLVTEVKGKEEIIFIHASTKAGVVESNLFSPWYQNVFVKAVRVL